MAEQDAWQFDSRTFLEPLRDHNLWFDDAYTCEPESSSSAIKEIESVPRVWTETDFDELQRTDSVPTAIFYPDVPSPEFAHPSSIDAYGRQKGTVSDQRTPSSTAGRTKQERASTPAVHSDREYRQEDEAQRLICSECGLEFENLQGLDKHSKSTQHKAWRCQEVGCGKMYARRDTFLRHRIKHTDNVHPCHTCSRINKHKVFKRKDHLKEHMRNCHSRSVDGTRSVPQHKRLKTTLTGSQIEFGHP